MKTSSEATASKVSEGEIMVACKEEGETGAALEIQLVGWDLLVGLLQEEGWGVRERGFKTDMLVAPEQFSGWCCYCKDWRKRDFI